MKKKKKLLLSIAVMVSSLTIGTTAYAANCPSCEASHVQVQCTSVGEHLWHDSYSHTKQYSVDGVLVSETCNVFRSEDKVSWICPRGHGVISIQYHYVESHSCEECTDLDYYHG